MPKKKENPPLSKTHPKIAKEALGWDPSLFTYGSNKKQDWKCKRGHTWKESPNKRANRGHNCPYCSGSRVLKGFNDLKTTHPKIAKEALGWDPTTVSAGSNKKLGWICVKKHVWQTSVGHRTDKKATGCPVCSGYKTVQGVNDLEKLFPEIAREAYGWDPSKISPGSNRKFAWQCPKGHTWVAIVSSRTVQKTGCPVCSNLKIVKGVNDLGTLHPNIASEADGWDPSKVGIGTSQIKKWKCKFGHNYSAMISKRTKRNQGCPVCANKKLVIGLNDLATTHPELALEAFGWDPTQVNAGRSSPKSGKLNEKRAWKCFLGHVWEATPASRTNTHHQSGCPVCSGNSLLIGFNDLATTHPEIAREAYGWDPKDYVAGGKQKKAWKCEVAGHIWKVSISERKAGRGCPSCAKSGFDPNKKGWLYFLEHPDWQMLQIGITNVPTDRLTVHKKLGWEMKEIRGPMNGELARQWETDILRMLRSKKVKTGSSEIAGRFTGYTESWLKDSFPAKDIMELMESVRDAEDSKNKPQNKFGKLKKQPN